MTNKDYWKRRFERLEQREMDKADQAMAELKKVYEYTLRQLRDEVIEWYNRYADENGLSLADARKQLDARELKAFKLTLKEYEKLAKQQDLSDEYIKMLDQASIRARLSRSQMLYIKTANYVEQLAKEQEINLTELLKDVYEDSYYRAAYETQSMQGAYDTFSEVPKASVEKTISRPWAEDGKDFSKRIWDNKTKLLNTLQSEITRTLIAAEGTTLLAGRIANRFNVSFSNAKRLAETETAYVQETARMDTWQKLHVAKYELIATLDSRTSPICREMDGKVFERADAKPGVTMPPFHCYCRTTTAPYIEGITDDDSTRAARDPDTGKTVQVPGKMNYADWKAVFVDKSKTLEDWREPKVADAAMAEEKKPFTPAKSKDEAFLRFKELTNPGFKNRVGEGVAQVHYIGKIDKEIYKVVTPDICTDEVIITDRQIQHIKERHPNDYERFVKYFEEALSCPDYILEANKPNSAMVLKEIELNNEKIKIILRLHTSTDPEGYKNSIITAQRVKERRYKQYIRNGKILYRKNEP